MLAQCFNYLSIELLAWLFRILLVLSLCSPALAQKGVYLGHLSWVKAKERFKTTPIVVIPFGAGSKEHGPHLPMNADRVVLEYLLDKAVETEDVIVAPPVLHGWFPAFRAFPGTEVRDPDVFRRYVQQVAESLISQGAQRIVFLNMGIFRATGLPLSIAAREVRAETGVPTLVVNWDDLETEEAAALFEQQSGGHADEVETSINLYLQPDKVDMSLAVKDYREHLKKNYGGYRPGYFARDKSDPAYSDTGLSGDPTLASAEKGRQVLDIMTKEWRTILRGFATSPTKGR
jgi:creatinine amidohydrolase